MERFDYDFMIISIGQMGNRGIISIISMLIIYRRQNSYVTILSFCLFYRFNIPFMTSFCFLRDGK